jgi:5-methylthioadenosine/S-adenosylhomocysteine deaminase
MRAMLGFPILDFPTPYAADADGYLQTGLAIRDALKHERSLSFSLAPHAPYTVGNPTWERIVVYARQLDLPIQTHVAETAHEVAQSIAEHGQTPLARLHALGATGPSFIAIHCVHLDSDDIALIATHGGHVVHCPVSNMKLGAGIAPVSALLAQGVNVALGTDGAASNNRLDMLGELRIAALLAKVATGDPAALPAQQALVAATLAGARALGIDREIGSLVAGKAADVIAVDLSTLDSSPCYDPVSHLVHAVGREAVSDVWVSGRRVVAGRALTTADEPSIVARARMWQERLQ